jgi:hypothetical protein
MAAVTQPTAPRLRLPAEWPLLLPAAVTIAVVAAWTLNDGGYESQPGLGARYQPDAWYLGGLTLLALACATALGVGIGRVRLSRATKLACAALAAYVGWSFASMLWAHDQGAAFLGSDRALVYLAAFTTFAILPWTDWSVRAALTMFVTAIGAIAIVTAVKLATLTDPGSLYIAQRLAYPLGYYNATAALFTTTAVVAIALSAPRDGRAPLRVLGLLVAAVCLQLAVLGQSRGWLYTAPIVLALMLVLIPGRLRLLAYASLPIAATAAITPVLLRVYARATPGGVALTQPRLSHVLHTQGQHVVQAMLIADAVLALVAVIAVGADRRLRVGRDRTRRLNRLAVALAALVAIAAVALGLASVHGDPIGRVERAWRSFADAHTDATGYSRFGTFASNRADIWRVALHEFAQHPLAGIGQDNFATSYTRLRHTYEQPRWTHSIELRLLTHTGLVGALLFLAFLVAALVAALRGRRRGGISERVSVGILLLALVVWLVHGSIDWLWEYPALSVPALAFTAAAGALGRTRLAVVPDRAGGRRRAALRTVAWIGAALAGAWAIAALAVPFLAARRLERALSVWPHRPALAYSEARSASDLLAFDARPDLVGGSIAVNRGEYNRARLWFREAQRREDQAWLTPFVLGLLDSEQGLRGAARAQLLRARERNPREPAIAAALDRVASRHPLTLTEAQEMLAQHITTPPA